jgi:hypothetical protein
MSADAASGRPDARHIDLPEGDWLFRLHGEVLGPVTAREIFDHMLVGEIDEATPLCLEEGGWQTVQQLPLWHPALYQAKAKLRAERARAEAERAASRRKIRNLINIGIGAAALVLTSFAVVYLLIVQNPWRNRQNLEAWAVRHVPLVGLPVALATGTGEGQNGAADSEYGNINIEKILIEDAPELVAVRPDGLGGRKRPRPNPGTRPPREGVDGGPPATAPDEARVADAGHASRAHIEARVYSAANMNRMKSCLVQEIRRNSDLPARVVISFSIKNDGRVHNVQMGDVRLEEGPLHQCFRRQLASLKVDEFGGQVQNVTIPFDWK